MRVRVLTIFQSVAKTLLSHRLSAILLQPRRAPRASRPRWTPTTDPPVHSVHAATEFEDMIVWHQVTREGRNVVSRATPQYPGG